MRIYLSGAIEYAPDQGRTWRAEITPFLQSLGHEVYDPALDERKNLTEEETSLFRSWKTSDLPRFQATVRKIIEYDLDWIQHRSDCVVCFWDQYAQRGAGTQGELTFAYRMNIPVHLIVQEPVTNVSGWILGCATGVYRSLDELRQSSPLASREAGIGV
jgi:hypothetical protein